MAAKWLSMVLIQVVVLTMSGCNNKPNIGQRGISFDVHPTENAIVFSASGRGTRDLYLLDLETLNVKQLTDSREMEADPSFSLDGKNIVYAAYSENNWESKIRLLNIESLEVKTLSEEKGVSDMRPRFVLGGHFIVFSRAHRLRNYSMGGQVWDQSSAYLMRSDGSKVKALPIGWFTTMSGERDYLVTFEPDSEPRQYHLLSISALHHFTLQESIDSDLLKKQALSGNSRDWQVFLSSIFKKIPKTMLTKKHNIPNEVLDAYSLAYSPEEDIIVFNGFHRDSDRRVWVFDRTTREQYPLLPEIEKHTTTECLNFAPSGRAVYYLKQEGNGLNMNVGLWCVATDGSNVEQVADHTLFDDPLNWKPKESR